MAAQQVSPAGHTTAEHHRPEPRSGLPDLISGGNKLQIVLSRMTRRLRQAHQTDGLTPAALTILSLLDSEGPLGCTELATRERITPQAISATLMLLAEQGLVERIRDDTDGRRTSMSVTQGGRDLLAGRRSRTAEAVAHAIDQALDDSERQLLLACLPLLQRVADHL